MLPAHSSYISNIIFLAIRQENADLFSPLLYMGKYKVFKLRWYIYDAETFINSSKDCLHSSVWTVFPCVACEITGGVTVAQVHV